MGFTGFPKATFDFLSDLKANNSKEWFDANRARYDAAWKKPALDLIDALAEPLAGRNPPLKAEARINGSLRRINRDVRFSKDKSPYNARMHLIFWAGSHPNRSSAFHLVLEPTGIGYGAGVFGLDAPSINAIRDRILDSRDRQSLLRAVNLAEAVGCRFDEPDLKRMPKGYQANGDWEHLLRRKAFVVRTMAPVGKPLWVSGPECVGHITDIAGKLMPFINWVHD